MNKDAKMDRMHSEAWFECCAGLRAEIADICLTLMEAATGLKFPPLPNFVDPHFQSPVVLGSNKRSILQRTHTPHSRKASAWFLQLLAVQDMLLVVVLFCLVLFAWR